MTPAFDDTAPLSEPPQDPKKDRWYDFARGKRDKALYEDSRKIRVLKLVLQSLAAILVGFLLVLMLYKIVKLVLTHQPPPLPVGILVIVLGVLALVAYRRSKSPAIAIERRRFTRLSTRSSADALGLLCVVLLLFLVLPAIKNLHWPSRPTESLEVSTEIVKSEVAAQEKKSDQLLTSELTVKTLASHEAAIKDLQTHDLAQDARHDILSSRVSDVETAQREFRTTLANLPTSVAKTEVVKTTAGKPVGKSKRQKVGYVQLTPEQQQLMRALGLGQ